MIEIITIDDHGQPIAAYVPSFQITLPVTAAGEIADRIYIRPDCPPLGSPEFDAKLRAWHAKQNGARHDHHRARTLPLPLHRSRSILRGIPVLRSADRRLSAGQAQMPPIGDGLIYPYYWQFED